MLQIRHHCFLCELPMHFKQHGICCSCARKILQQRDDDSYCDRCGLAINQHICDTFKPVWKQMIYLSDYQKPLSQLIQRLKFSREYYLANSLARLLFLKWFDLYQQGKVKKPDRIISVPLHPLRFWWRSFNQSDLIAKPLAYWLGCQYSPDSIIRQRYTPHQSNLNAQAREKNLMNAFKIKENISGIDIVLVDDVVTTGTTIQEISNLLIDNGANSVSILAICRTL